MSSFPPPTTVPAGWYPDPSGCGVRYYDGRAWAPDSPLFEQRLGHPSLPATAALGALAVLAASLVFGRSVVAPALDGDSPVDVVVSALIGYGPSVLWCWYVWQRWAGRRAGAVGWDFRWGDLWRGPATYLTAIGVQVALALVLVVLDVPIARNVDDTGAASDRGYVAAAVIVTTVAAPIIEELIFRGVVLRGFLSRYPPVAAVAAQGVLFGSAHFDPSRGAGNIGLVIVLSGVGIVLGASAYLSRRIGPAVVAHAIFNGVVMIIVLSGVLDDVDSGFDGALSVVAACSLWTM